jgi:hypothetical protein
MYWGITDMHKEKKEILQNVLGKQMENTYHCTKKKKKHLIKIDVVSYIVVVSSFTIEANDVLPRVLILNYF